MENEWIKHDGGACPVRFAKAGEYEVKFRSGRTSIGTHDANTCYWGNAVLGGVKEADIVAYRLTDRWIPIIDRKFPLSVNPGEAEIKWANGRTGINEHPWEEGISTGFTNIVAVRLIKQREVPEATPEDKAIYQSIADNYFKETEKQRLTREASIKYFAKIHTMHNPVRPLTEDQINDIAAAALREHDRVWPRKD